MANLMAGAAEAGGKIAPLVKEIREGAQGKAAA
jgi:hypothetical protein